MTISPPDIAVCIPTYEPDLDQLRELLIGIPDACGNLNFEVIVSDDASTNAATLQVLLRDFPFPVRFISQQHRVGMVENWNQAASAATAEFVTLPGQDDRLAYAGLERAVNSISGDASVILGVETYIDATGKSTTNPRRSPDLVNLKTRWRSLSHRQAVSVSLIFGNVLGDPCVGIIRSEALRRVGGFPRDYVHAVDLACWLLLSQLDGVLEVVDTKIAERRIHSRNATVSHVASGAAGADREKLFRSWIPYIYPESLARQARARIWLHDLHDVLQTRQSLWRKVAAATGLLGRPPLLGLGAQLGVEMGRQIAIDRAIRRIGLEA